MELITDHETELFIYSSIRGGVSRISHRIVKVNNPYMEGCDDSIDTSYIAYWDRNYLNGFSMSQQLPYRGFMFLPTDCIDSCVYMNVASDATTRYLLEVDVDYPEHLHDAHNDYHLVPENSLITHDMLSPFFCLLIQSMSIVVHLSEFMEYDQVCSASSKCANVSTTWHDSDTKSYCSRIQSESVDETIHIF
jgi:hypothetical protein